MNHVLILNQRFQEMLHVRSRTPNGLPIHVTSIINMIDNS